MHKSFYKKSKNYHIGRNKQNENISIQFTRARVQIANYVCVYALSWKSQKKKIKVISFKLRIIVV